MAITNLCTPAELQARFDHRTIGRLISDSDTIISQSAQLTDTNLLAILKEASGRFLSVYYANPNYTEAGLEAIMDADGVMAEYVRGLVAKQAMYMLYQRRPDLRMERPDYFHGLDWEMQSITFGNRALSEL